MARFGDAGLLLECLGVHSFPDMRVYLHIGEGETTGVLQWAPQSDKGLPLTETNL